MAGDDTEEGLEIIEVSGVKIPIDPEIMSPKIIEILRQGDGYDHGRAKLAPRLIEPGERVLDLGAGLGFISAIVARQGKASLVAAVEADPCVIPLIRAVHRLNGLDCVIRNAAVVAARTADTIPFYVHKDLWASSLMPLPEESLKRVDQVPVATFAELFSDYAPTLLMLDFEVLRELVPNLKSPETDVMDDIDFRPVPKILLMLKQKVLGLRGVKRAFDVLSGQGFAYDPAFSQGNNVLMRRVE